MENFCDSPNSPNILNKHFLLPTSVCKLISLMRDTVFLFEIIHFFITFIAHRLVSMPKVRELQFPFWVQREKILEWQKSVSVPRYPGALSTSSTLWR